MAANCNDQPRPPSLLSTGISYISSLSLYFRSQALRFDDQRNCHCKAVSQSLHGLVLQCSNRCQIARKWRCLGARHRLAHHNICAYKKGRRRRCAAWLIRSAALCGHAREAQRTTRAHRPRRLAAQAARSGASARQTLRRMRLTCVPAHGSMRAPARQRPSPGAIAPREIQRAAIPRADRHETATVIASEPAPATRTGAHCWHRHIGAAAACVCISFRSARQRPARARVARQHSEKYIYRAAHVHAVYGAGGTRELYACRPSLRASDAVCSAPARLRLRLRLASAAATPLPVQLYTARHCLAAAALRAATLGLDETSGMRAPRRDYSVNAGKHGVEKGGGSQPPVRPHRVASASRRGRKRVAHLSIRVCGLRAHARAVCLCRARGARAIRSVRAV
eukprot:IDg14573t1